jgi:hypothetical protein
MWREGRKWFGTHGYIPRAMHFFSKIVNHDDAKGLEESWIASYFLLPKKSKYIYDSIQSSFS